MQVQVITRFGGPECLELAEVAKPEVGHGQVLVRIHAASVNPVDIKIREGLPIGPELPAILGADLAGVVEAIGAGVTGFAIGDEVYGCAGGVKGQGGTLAQYIAADARLLAPKPKTLSFREAAALPLVSITAWEAVERAAIKANQDVLVQGGLGGVGHIAVQLARHAGARVSTTLSARGDASLAQALGADEVIDFSAESVADYVQRITRGRGFDVIIDTVGGQNLLKSFEAAAIGGQVSTTNARATIDLSNMHAKALSLHLVFMLLPMLRGEGRERHGEILRELGKIVDAGGVRPLIDPRKFSLAEAAEAHRHLASGEAVGKIVINVD